MGRLTTHAMAEDSLAELIPEAQLVIIHGSGHFPMLENPQTFNEVLEEFLSNKTDSQVLGRNE